MVDENDLLTKDKILAMRTTQVDLPAYHSFYHDCDKRASTRRLGQLTEHVVNDVLGELMHGDKEVVIDTYRHPGGSRELEASVVRPYVDLCAWFQEIIGSDEPTALPRKQYAKEVIEGAFGALNPQHPYGNFARIFLSAMYRTLGLGDLGKDPPTRQWTR